MQLIDRFYVGDSIVEVNLTPEHGLILGELSPEKIKTQRLKTQK